MKHSLFKSAVSIGLAAAVTVTALPSVAFAKSEYLRKVDFSRPKAVTEMNSVTYEKEETLREPKKYYSEPEPEGTLVAIDEYSKTYQIDENSFITQIGGEANTYKDEDGTPQIVDNTLVEKSSWFSADYFENKANDYTIKLPAEITNNKGIKLTKDGYSVELIPQSGDFSKPVAADNAVLYNDVFEGIDY